MRNKKRERIINIIFLLYMLIMFIINLFTQSENLHGNTIGNFILVVIILMSTIIQNFLIIAVFIVIKVMRKIEYKNQLSKIDVKNEKQYYRDMLKGYSPFLLSYIDNFVFEEKRDIIATLLNLQLKKIIKIEDNNIIKLNENANLEESEKYILNIVQNGKIKIENTLELEKKIENDAYSKDLIQIKKSFKENNNDILKIKFVKAFVINVIIFIIISIIVLIANNEILVNVSLFWGIILCNPILYVILYIIKYYLSKPKIKRTEKGEEINIKLEGLKNYIKEYSNLKDRKSSDILLWEEYLIYSVIFGMNDNIVIEMNKLFE